MSTRSDSRHSVLRGSGSISRESKCASPILLIGFVACALVTVSLHADEPPTPELKTHEGRITRVEGQQLTVLVGKMAMTFQVEDSAKVSLDGTPVPLARLAMAQFATVKAEERRGKFYAVEVAARSKAEPPKAEPPKSGRSTLQTATR